MSFFTLQVPTWTQGKPLPRSTERALAWGHSAGQPKAATTQPHRPFSLWPPYLSIVLGTWLILFIGQMSTATHQAHVRWMSSFLGTQLTDTFLVRYLTAAQAQPKRSCKGPMLQQMAPGAISLPAHTTGTIQVLTVPEPCVNSKAGWRESWRDFHIIYLSNLGCCQPAASQTCWARWGSHEVNRHILPSGETCKGKYRWGQLSPHRQWKLM